MTPAKSGPLPPPTPSEGSGQGQAVECPRSPVYLALRASLRVVGRALGLVAVAVLVLLLIATHPQPHAPVPAQREAERQHREERASQGAEEETRQAQYARPGGPEPTGGWTP